MALVDMDAGEAEPRRPNDVLDKIDRWLAGPGAAPAHPAINLDQHIERDVRRRRGRGRGQVGNVPLVIGQDGDPCSPGEVCQSADHRRSNDLVGDEDILDPAIGPSLRPRSSSAR